MAFGNQVLATFIGCCIVEIISRVLNRIEVFSLNKELQASWRAEQEAQRQAQKDADV